MSPVLPVARSRSMDLVDASAADARLDTPRSSSVRRPKTTLCPDRRLDTPRGSAFRHEPPEWR